MLDIGSKNKNLVGLDIGASSLKLAEVLSTANGYVLNRFLQIPLPKGIIVEGVLNDPKALSLKIKELFWNSSCRGKGVVASLSGNSVVVKKATFAQMDETELRDLIRDEAGKYLPFDNMGEANYEFEDNEIVVIVRIGADLTTINVIKGGMSIFTRDFTLGGNSITQGLQEKYGVTFEAAEKIQVNGIPGSDQDNLDLRNNILDFAEPICSEIERSIDYFRSTFGGEYIKRIYLSGGSSKIPGLAANLSQKLNAETELINPLLKIGYNKRNIDPKTAESIKPIAAVAIGLGLRTIGDK